MAKPLRPATLRNVPFGRSAVSRRSAITRGLLRIVGSGRQRGRRWLLLGSAVVAVLAVLALIAFN